jgi:hypothetical protein
MKIFQGEWFHMEKKLLVAGILAGLVFLGCSLKTSEPWQSNDEKPTGARVGLKRVAVFVDLAKPPGTSQEISRSQLQTDVETRIRRAGVNVVSHQPTTARPEMPLIYLNVKIAKIDDMYAYNVDILCMAVSRGQAMPSKLANCNLGTSGLVAALGQVREKVADLVNLFIKDYLSAKTGAPAVSFLHPLPASPLRLTAPPA